MASLLAVITLGLPVALCSAQMDQSVEDTTSSRVIATILGKSITMKERDKLNGLILGALLEKFAKENRIEPTEEELNTFIKKSEEADKKSQIKFEQDREKLLKELKSSSLSDRKRKEKESHLQDIESILKTNREMQEQAMGKEEQMRPMKRQMAQHFVRTWKINKALYSKYGGRVIFQQAGVEPLDAYREFLKEQERAGAFRILDKQYEPSFWKYFTDDGMHTFYSKGDGAKFINTPWWLMEESEDK